MMRDMWCAAGVLVPVVKTTAVIAAINASGVIARIVTDKMAVTRGLVSLGWRMVALGIILISDQGFQGSSDEGVKVPPTLKVRLCRWWCCGVGASSRYWLIVVVVSGILEWRRRLCCCSIRVRCGCCLHW